MAWGFKKNRELEYRKTGQAAALEIGDLGASDAYNDSTDDFKASWEVDTDDLDLGNLEPDRQP